MKKKKKKRIQFVFKLLYNKIFIIYICINIY